jgi:hypothetical protein
MVKSTSPSRASDFGSSGPDFIFINLDGAGGGPDGIPGNSPLSVDNSPLRLKRPEGGVPGLSSSESVSSLRFLFVGVLFVGVLFVSLVISGKRIHDNEPSGNEPSGLLLDCTVF